MNAGISDTPGLQRRGESRKESGRPAQIEVRCLRDVALFQ